MKKQNISCPLCGGQVDKVYSVKAFIGDYKLTIGECSNCKLAFQSSQPSPEESTSYMNWRYTSTDPSDDYITNVAGKKRVAIKRIEWLNTINKPNKQLLDIGAGVGIFCSIASRFGYTATGTEICPEAAEKAKNVFGVNLVSGDITSIPENSEYGVITLWDVIEHVRDPLFMLKEAFARMKSGGVLVILTANYDSKNRLLMGGSWPMYLFDHMFYFSPDSLKQIVTSAGFTDFELHRLPTSGLRFSARQKGILLLSNPVVGLQKGRKFFILQLKKFMSGDNPSNIRQETLLITARKK